MWDNLNLVAVLSVVLIFEGMLPLLFPSVWKEVFRRLIRLSDGQVRFYGLISVGVGLIAWWLIA
jgi:uncharacterized protein